MFDLTNLIPQVAAAKTALVVGAVAALFSGGLYIGYQWGSKALPEAVSAQQIDFAKKVQKRWELSDSLLPVYVDRIEKVREEARVIIHEVPHYVKDSCSLSTGLRVLHDSATTGHLPDPTGHRNETGDSPSDPTR